MKKCLLLTSFTLLFIGLPTQAQPTQDEELAFVQQLRSRGYADLALEYLENKLSKNPKYAADLPLEIAQTRLDMAGSDPDASKRIDLYTQAKKDFEAFVQKHPTHPRVNSAKLTIAQIAALQGKVQLARALAIPEGDESRAADLKKASQLLDDAIKGLEETAAQLNTEEAKNNSALERGQLLISKAKIAYELDNIKEGGDVIKSASALLNDLSDQMKNADPLRPQVIAWAGRAYSMGGQPNEAKKKYIEAKATNDRAAVRLVRYFEILSPFEEKKEELPDVEAMPIIRAAQEWMATYPSYRNSPEGFGIQYILAKLYFTTGGSKTGVTRDTTWNVARGFINRLEATDNEYSSKAQQLKVRMLFELKAFERNIATLATFDDCYMRALYEHQQLMKNEKDKFSKEEDKAKQQKLIVDVLKRALGLAKGKKVNEVDLSNAYYLLTGYYITTKENVEAAKVGEEFARTYPKAKQASLCAMFAAEALSTAIKKSAADDYEAMPAEREKLFDLGKFMAERWPGDKAGEYGRYLVVSHLIKKPVAGKDDAEKKAERKKREAEAIKIGGDVARFQVGTERAKERKFLDSILLLKDVKPDFNNYTLSQYQLALAALQLQEENDAKRKADPKAVVVQLPGDKREFRDIAAEALEKIPDPAGNDSELTQFYLRAKIRLGFLFYSVKKYAEMDTLAKKLTAVAEGLKGDAAMDKQTFLLQIGAIRLYGVYGKADDLYRAEKYMEAVAVLDPLISELKEGKYPEIKENPALMGQVMGMALRGNMLIERVQQAKAVFEVWKTLERDRIKQKTQSEVEKLETGIKTLENKADKTDEDKALLEQQKKQLEALKGQTSDAALADALRTHRANVLQQTFAVMKKQIDEMRKKNEKEKLERTVNAFSALLAEEKGDDKSLSPEIRLLLAQCYASIHRYQQGLDLISKYPPPPPNADPKSPEIARHRVSQVLQIHCMRLLGKENKDAKSFEQAKKLIDTIMVDPKGPMGQGWGRRDLNALKEEIELLIDMKAFGAAVNRCNSLLAILGPKLKEGGAMRDHYFEVSYFYIVAFTNAGLNEMDAAKKENFLSRTASFYSKLLAGHPTLGGDESKERFQNFLDKTPEGLELKKYIDKVKQ